MTNEKQSLAGEAKMIGDDHPQAHRELGSPVSGGSSSEPSLRFLDSSFCGHAVAIGFVWVRQAKSGGSCQLRGTDHGNCSFAMKLTSGVMGNRAVEAWGRDDLSRNASEPDSAS